MPLLLLLRLPWLVWGAEAFLGEWERAPRGRGGHCQVMEGLKPRECAAGKTGTGRVWKAVLGPIQGLSPVLGLGVQTCVLRSPVSSCPTPQTPLP